MLQSSVAQIRLPSLLSQLQLAQSNVSLHIVGLHLDASLSWTTHINIIVGLSKASKRLYFLKQLKRAGVPPHQLLHVTLQYFVQFWNTPTKSGTIPSLALNPANWNQSKNEQYISSSVTPVACHILTSYLLPTH